MLCSRPYKRGVAEFGCGQCMPCRLNRRRLWTGRLMIEAASHEFSHFLTLTYRDEDLPLDGSVNPRHTQLWLKRLRRDCGRLRYYLVGEYGDISSRPHYHVVLFGPEISGHVAPAVCHRRGIKCSCVVCNSWPFGACDVGSLTTQSAGYIVSYVTKRMTKFDDPRLDGRHPEFARMSLKPGIGGGSISPISDFNMTKEGAVYVAETGDVPNVVRMDGGVYPLGRYLRSKIRASSGFGEIGEPTLARLARERSLAGELKQPDAVRARREKRIQDARRAKSFVSRTKSKKGVGI